MWAFNVYRHIPHDTGILDISAFGILRSSFPIDLGFQAITSYVEKAILTAITCLQHVGFL